MHTRRAPSTLPTHPLRNIRPSFLGDELEHTSVRVLALLPVDELQHHGPLYVQSRHLVEGRWRQQDLGAVVELGSFGAGGHDKGKAAIILVEALGASSASHIAAGHLE